jgi:hypothetical protein
MGALKDVVRILVALGALAACLWLWIKLLDFLDSHGLRLPTSRGDPRHEPPKLEIQTLFHGNTKDEDQI